MTTSYVVGYGEKSSGIAHAVPVGVGAEAVCGVFTPDVRDQTPFPPTPGPGTPGACRDCIRGIARIEAALRDKLRD